MVDAPSKKGTPLHYAAMGGHLQAVRELIRRGASVHAIDSLGYTPLCEAIDHGHEIVVKELVSHGAKVTGNHIEIVKMLISLGASMTEYKGRESTPLQYAVAQSAWESMRELIKAGANVNMTDSDGSTALCMAALQVVKELISYGATVNVAGSPPLIYAAIQGHVEIIKERLRCGADLQAKNQRGYTPLIGAASYGK